MSAKSFLEQLREMTVVVADTGDFEAIRSFRPRDTTTNPSLIAAAAQMPEYQYLVDETLLKAKEEAGKNASRSTIAKLAFDNLAISFGLRILEIVPGRVSTEVDARLSWDTEATLEKARYLISRYESSGIDRTRVLIKIAATWEGIRAAEILEKDGIHCNLTLLFGMHQAIACAEAGVTLISPFVGRILDWFKKDTGINYEAKEDPGVISVTNIYNYYKKFGYKTEVMGASFRNTGEIIELAGCDLLTISPALLNELEKQTGHLERRLEPSQSFLSEIEKISIDKTAFETMHQKDRMASEKLNEGIQGFTKALEATENLLMSRLQLLELGHDIENWAHSFFGKYDLDGDGFISREEWLGTDAVFDAMDQDKDGMVSVVELRTGLGAVLQHN